MIFLDTSAIYALADRADPNHEDARRVFAEVLSDHGAFVTHNYVLVESAALLQHRLGMAPAARFLEESRAFQVQWVDERVHREAESRWARGRRGVSFVDQVSFVIMERLRIARAFAFDPDFKSAGFQLMK